MSATITRIYPRLSTAQLLALAPAGTKRIIYAEQVEDTSDIMSDYHGHTIKRTVVIGFSKSSREDFRNLRKAAATFEPTKHLGPGKDVYTLRILLNEDVIPTGAGGAYWKGSFSHWHSELLPDGLEFETEAEALAYVEKAGQPGPIHFQVEGGTQLVTFRWDVRQKSIEHRENYSMGGGNYLKAGGRHDSGWSVRSHEIHPQWTRTQFNNAECAVGT